MILLFLPIAFDGQGNLSLDDAGGRPDHAVQAKYPLFTMPGYYISAAVLFAVWWLYSNRLRYWSLRQDETGSAHCTHGCASSPPRASSSSPSR